MKAQPRALHILYSLDFGGTETQLRLIAESAEKRFEHSYCTLAGGGACADAIRRAGAEVHELGIEAWRHPAKALAALRLLLKKQRPDVVHCHAADGNWFGLFAAFFAQSPVRIGEEVGMPEHGLKARLAYRVAYSTAHRVIAVSDAVASKIVDLGEAPASKIARIYNPVRLFETQATCRAPGEPLRIACVGRLEQWKGPLVLARAAAILRDLNFKLLFIGDGSQRGELEALVAADRIGDRVEICGFIGEPEQLLAGCHLYVQPSPSEGFGIAAVEAMSCSLPVIASVYGGVREFLEEGVDGWLLANLQPRDFADAIRKAVSLEPETLAEMGKHARRSVLSRFDPQQYVRQLEDLYEELWTSRP